MPATLRLRREGNMGFEFRRRQFDILVDGDSVGTIDRHGKAEATIDPGQHTLRIQGGRYTSRDRTFDAADGQVISFRCHGAMLWPRWVVSLVLPGLGIALLRE